MFCSIGAVVVVFLLFEIARNTHITEQGTVGRDGTEIPPSIIEQKEFLKFQILCLVFDEKRI